MTPDANGHEWRIKPLQTESECRLCDLQYEDSRANSPCSGIKETEDVVAELLALKPFLEAHHCSTEVIDAAVADRQSLSDRIDVLEGAGNALVTKLDECSEPLNNVFAFYAVHGFVYDGPQYGEALEALRASLRTTHREGNGG